MSVGATARRQIAQGLVAEGIPRDEADMTADVAMHAAEQMLATLRRVTGTLDGRAWLNAYGFALQAGAQMLTQLHEDVQIKAAEAGYRAGALQVDTRQ